MNNSDKLREWLADRPAIALQRLAKEAGIPKMALYDLNRGIDLPGKHWGKLLPVLKKYGWK